MRSPPSSRPLDEKERDVPLVDELHLLEDRALARLARAEEEHLEGEKGWRVSPSSLWQLPNPFDYPARPSALDLEHLRCFVADQ